MHFDAMVRITIDLLRSKTEQGGVALPSLRELALHQQGIEKIDVINQACRHLTCLYLQNNIIERIENLYRLKELQHLNLAINNIQAVEGLSRCESLRKLDLTLNFIPAVALPTVATLAPCEDLRELYLLGNPCAQWPGYRDYVVAVLPQLRSLDGQEVTVEERQRAMQLLPAHKAAVEELQNNDHEPRFSGLKSSRENEEGEESSFHWTPEARVQEQREAEKREARVAQSQNPARQEASLESSLWRQLGPPREALPDLPDDCQQPILQCNEGEWKFTLEEEELAPAGRSFSQPLVLTVHLEPHLDVRAVQIDVRPTFIRVLARGRLLQLRLPVEVRADEAAAQRSTASGRLVVKMPLDSGEVQRAVVKTPINRKIANKSAALPEILVPGLLLKKQLAAVLLQSAAVAPALLDDSDSDAPPLRA